MVNLPENIKQFLRFAKKNYIVTLAVLCIVFVGAVSAYKLFIVRPVYVYARVKVGQGLWWATTQRPSPWFIDAIKKAKNEKERRSSSAKILDMTYYPWYGSGQYDVFLTVRLRVTRSGTGYSYDQSSVGVGSPIDLDFGGVQFSGTITEMNAKPFNDVYIEKKVTLTKKGAFPWEADAITVGDTFNNGETTTLKILGKQVVDTFNNSTDTYGNTAVDMKKYITVTVELKGKMEDGQLVYYGDQIVTPGRSISLATSNFIFNDFMIAKVE